MKYIYYFSALLILVSISSCSDALEGKSINKGGTSRSNNYQDFDELPTQMTESIMPNAKDTSASVLPPLILSSNTYVLVSEKSTIIYVSQDLIKWEKKIPNDELPAANMCADKDKGIYIITQTGTILSYSAGGKLLWQTKLMDSVRFTDTMCDLLAVDDGIIAATSAGIIAKYSFTGKRQWVYNSNLSPAKFFPADKENNIYVGLSNNEFGKTDSLIALNSNGKLLWSKPLENARIIRGCILSQDKIIIQSMKEESNRRANIITAFDLKGNLKWNREIPVMPKYLSADNDGVIYAAGYNTGIGEALTGLFAITEDGNIKWKLYFQTGIASPVIVSPDALAFSGISKNGPLMIYLKKSEGTMFKNISLSNFPPLNLEPAIRPDGTIIFTTTNKLMLVKISAPMIKKYFPF